MSVFVSQHAETMCFSKDVWVILNPIERSIKDKIEKYGTPLKKWDISINYGIKTGCNEAFIIDGAKRAELIAADPKSDEIIRPILRGRDIKRNGYEFADLWLICTFPSLRLDIDDYPAIRDWLSNGTWTLEKTKGNPPTPLGTGKLRLEQTGATHNINGIVFKSRKKTNNKWFETQDSIAYWNDFSKQKIVFSRISGNEPCFAADNAGMMTNDTGYIITGNHIEYLLEKLCSDTYWYAFKSFYMGGGIDKEFKVNNLSNLPIPLPGTPEPDLTEAEKDLILTSLQ